MDFASCNNEGSSVAKYTLFLSTCILRARSSKRSSTCTMYSSMGWNAASVPTLSVLRTWTLHKGRHFDKYCTYFSKWNFKFNPYIKQRGIKTHPCPPRQSDHMKLVCSQKQYNNLTREAKGNWKKGMTDIEL